MRPRKVACCLIAAFTCSASRPLVDQPHLRLRIVRHRGSAKTRCTLGAARVSEAARSSSAGPEWIGEMSLQRSLDSHLSWPSLLDHSWSREVNLLNYLDSPPNLSQKEHHEAVTMSKAHLLKFSKRQMNICEIRASLQSWFSYFETPVDATRRVCDSYDRHCRIVFFV